MRRSRHRRRSVRRWRQVKFRGMTPVRFLALALTVMFVVGCAQTASPSPGASTPPPASQPLPPRFQDSSAPLPAVAGAFVLFQPPTERRLRAISFGAEANGFLNAQVDETFPGARWSQ